MLFSAVVALAAPLVGAVSITDYEKNPLRFSWPAAREGWTAGLAKNAPCGGASLGERTEFPLTGGQISLVQSTPVDSVNIRWTNISDPTKFHDFKRFTDTLSDLGAGHYCTPGPDFATLGFKAGDDASLLLQYQLDGQEDKFYSCADLKLVDTSSFVKPNFVCGNYTDEVVVATTTATGHSWSTSSAAAAGAASDSNSYNSSKGLSNAAAGGIGAGVTVGVLALLLGALAAAKLVHFGKKQVALVGSDTSSDVKHRV